MVEENESKKKNRAERMVGENESLMVIWELELPLKRQKFRTKTIFSCITTYI